MPDEMMSIGELARASGLGVSALRYYDGAGVLPPAEVDPRSGYRRYSRAQLADARLVARLRRVGMPVAGMRALLAGRADRPLVAALLSEHLDRLEAGLAAARTELELIMNDLDATPTTCAVAAADLRRALDAVRFALPGGGSALDAVLLDVAADTLTAVATDRYRMALCTVPVTERTGPPARPALPAADLPRLGGLLAAAGTARLRVADGTVAVSAGAGRAEVTAGGEYPDYRRVAEARPRTGRRVGTDVDTLRDLLVAGPVHHVPDCDAAAALALDPSGRLTLLADPGADGLLAAVNRRYLVDALDAAPSGQLTLEVDGPLHPLAIGFPDTPDTWSVLMPLRLP